MIRPLRAWQLPLAIGMLVMSIAPLQAQPDAPTRQPPQIVISAQGEVQVTPDRARVVLGVETEARTAQEASQLNATLQTRILEAVRRAGIPAASIRTTGYNVAPRQEYNPDTRTWRIDGYRVSNLVVVIVEPVGNAGAVIDAALHAGANRVASLSFEVKDPRPAREQALKDAVDRARREADITAAAAGGRIVGLLEITVNSYEPSPPRPMMEMAMVRSADSTPISEGTQPVVVQVTTRWEFSGTR
jgi:uncharacterized protein